MRSFWLVAKQEYRHMVMRRAFLLLTLAIPVGMAALILLVIVVETSGQNTLPIGYVDPTGLVDSSRQATLPDASDRIKARPYADEEAALAALEREEIQAFFVLPSDYPHTLKTDLYYLEEPPSEDAWADFDEFIRANLVANLPDDVAQRLLQGPNIVVKDIVSNREFSEASIINIILPLVATFLFFFATLSASGYMLGVVATEKENRTMEVMITSITPGQLIGGKTVGLLAASLTQLALYGIAAVVGLSVAAPYVPELQQATVPWTYLGVMALFFFPAFGLIAAILIAIGSAVTELQQGQQVAGILNLFFMVPIFLLPLILANPNHPTVVFFSLFPTTSFLTISLRWGLGTVPIWQLAVSWVLLVGTSLFTVWLAARVFRMGMLRYGQPLSLSAVVSAVRR